MRAEQQLLLPYASLDFPGRSTVTLQEIAEKIGISCDTLERHIDDGSLVALDAARRHTSRRLLRVPIEEYRTFAAKCLTGPKRREFFAQLPHATLREISAEITSILTASPHHLR